MTRNTQKFKNIHIYLGQTQVYMRANLLTYARSRADFHIRV